MKNNNFLSKSVASIGMLALCTMSSINASAQANIPVNSPDQRVILNFTDLQPSELVTITSSGDPANFQSAVTGNCMMFNRMHRSYGLVITGNPGLATVRLSTEGLAGIDNQGTIRLWVDSEGNGPQDNNAIQASSINPNMIIFDGIQLASGARLYFGEYCDTYFTSMSGTAHQPIWSRYMNGNNPRSLSSTCGVYNLNLVGGAQVVMAQPMTVQSLNIASTAQLTLAFTGTSGLLNVKGNFTCTGGFVPNTFRVDFSGTAPQTIAGNIINFSEVGILNAAGVTVACTEARIAKALHVNGKLTTGDKVTLQSTPSQTAYIPQLSGASEIIGKVKLERYFNRTFAGWVYLAPGVDGSTYADWNDDLPTGGFAGANNMGSGSPAGTIQTYQEEVPGSFNIGFSTIGAVTNYLHPRRGHRVYVPAGNYKPSVTGLVYQGDVNLPVSYTNNGFNTADGYNLVANPYPCPINWNSSAWVKNNISPTIIMFNSSTGTFSTYTQGFGTNAANGIIASSQSFFVRATGQSPMLVAKEAVKAPGVNAQFRTESTLSPLSFTLYNDLFEDECQVITGLTAENAIVGEKFVNLGDAPSFGLVDATGTLTAINSIENEGSFPIYLNIPVAGSYTIRFSAEDRNYNAYIVHTKSGKRFDFSNNGEITLDLTAGESSGDYTLVIAPDTITLAQEDASKTDEVDEKSGLGASAVMVKVSASTIKVVNVAINKPTSFNLVVADDSGDKVIMEAFSLQLGEEKLIDVRDLSGLHIVRIQENMSQFRYVKKFLF